MRWLSVLVLTALASCSAHDAPPPRTTAIFDFEADLHNPAAFFDAPYPSDLRLSPRGGPDLTGLPFPAYVTLFDGLRTTAMDRAGYPVVPVGYFKFTGPLAPQDANAVIAADARAAVLLIDLETASLLPTVASTPDTDDYVPENVLAVAARPGIVLRPAHAYAFVVTKALRDARGDATAPAAAMADLRAGRAPSAANALFAPLWDALTRAGVDGGDVVSATVFTTGDVVRELSDLTEAIAAKYTVTIDDLHVDPDDGAAHPRFCELVGTVTFPQFQRGNPPFDREGLFAFGTDGLPIHQRDERAPFAMAIPKGVMPARGYPLVTYFHGSGGLSSALVDRGRWVVTSDAASCPEHALEDWNGTKGCNTKGEGPAHVLAPFGFAMAGSALPVNPERLPGASDTAYLNFNNLAAGRDLFRQGVIEQRLLLDALLRLALTPAQLAPCTGVTLPEGATAFHFDSAHVYAQGQSMGGQYTNLVGATDRRVGAVVPTGAGGYWSHFILRTPLFENAAGKVALLLGTRAALTFMHPGMHVFETAWEPVDPMVYVPRLARAPLEGHPARPIYEPVGLGDSYFPTETYDAMALAYGNTEVGEEVWSSMQDALALDGRAGLPAYPLTLVASYTGAVVQYRGDGVYDPHALYSQLDAVKYQYGCFLSSFLNYGVAKVPAPAALGTACP